MKYLYHFLLSSLLYVTLSVNAQELLVDPTFGKLISQLNCNEKDIIACSSRGTCSPPTQGMNTFRLNLDEEYFCYNKCEKKIDIFVEESSVDSSGNVRTLILKLGRENIPAKSSHWLWVKILGSKHSIEWHANFSLTKPYYKGGRDIAFGDCSIDFY